MKKVIALLLALSMMLALAACGGKTDGPDTVKDTLVVTPERMVDSYDPFTAAQYDTVTMNQVMDTLFMWDGDGNVVGRLAESWTESEDGLVITTKLHEGVKFHDGTDFNADAVVWNYEQLMAGTWGSAFSAYVANIEKVDDYTVNITKVTPVSTALDIMCYFMLIASPTAYEADPAGFATHPVGTGAYIWQDKDSATDTITMTANEDYFLGAPAIKNLKLVTPMDSATALVSLEKGELNYALALTNSDIELAQSTDTVNGMTSAGWSTLTMMLVGEPMSSDQNLRNAIAYAIDREGAATYNNEADYVACNDIFSGNIMGELSGKTTVSSYDPAKAAEYLAQSNYDGSVININTLGVYENVATSIQNDLNAIGIKTQINTVDRATWSEMMTNGTLGISTIDFGGVYNGPVEMMSYFVSTGYYGLMGIFGQSEECDAAYNAIFEATPDTLEAATLNAVQLMSDLNNFTSLYELIFTSACTSDLAGVEAVWASTQTPYFYQVSFQ
ncbi:MAG: ABC transporter substrate-binding protein [Oscillospiraceae bacterium]|nr:ABC transporter substrate-binding protein [Oscillospiraceae bacterium]